MGRILLIALAAATLVVGVSLAQGGSEESQARALPGLPSYTAGYKGWFKLNRSPIPPRRTGDAHLGVKNVYASKRIRGARYPYGTVIVKEIARPGSGFVGVVAVMRKVKGASPRNNDWEMIEYVRGSTRSRFGVLARGAVCYACHGGVRGRDFVFTRG
ncbi:MAG: cytochrome P460 family protein [Gaiellaceae bacterium]